MEGGGLGKAATLPYVWSPGWNSNQAISQFQQEVAGPLLHSPPQLRLTLAPSAEQGSQQEDNAGQADNTGLPFVPIYQIFGSDHLAIRTPQFKLMFPNNYLQISPSDADKLGLTDCSLVKVRNDLGQHWLMALDIDERLPGSYVAGFVAENGCRPKAMSVVSIERANDAESQEFDLQNHRLRQQALTERDAMLAQLQQHDQFIPIRMVAGGLNDG